MSPEERKANGAAFNGCATRRRAIAERKTALARCALDARLAAERVDVTLPRRPNAARHASIPSAR